MKSTVMATAGIHDRPAIGLDVLEEITTLTLTARANFHGGLGVLSALTSV